MGIHTKVKKQLMIVLFLMGISIYGIQSSAQEMYMDNIGVVIRDTQILTAANEEAVCLGYLKKDTRVAVISELSHFVIIKYEDKYAYLPYDAIRLDIEYEKKLGRQRVYENSYDILITEGEIYEKSVDILMKAYQEIPEKIRKAFADNGFLIKMSEWDVAEEAYAPYGGYEGIGKVKAVFDYEKKILYVNDEWPMEIVHEMGHFVNDYLNMYSSLPENKVLFYNESDKISIYAETNDREFFAEAFRLYIMEPILLQSISPSVYIMVDVAVNIFI